METAEPLILGFSSGLLCLASCGPVLLPWLAAAGAGWRDMARLLAVFLAGRLAGYLAFAVAAWALGLALPLPLRAAAVVFAFAHLGLAVALLAYALPRRASREAACAQGRALAWRRRLARRFRALAPAVLGLLTGLNLCPPFVAAGVRAAEIRSLGPALAFFALFFAGTAVWFLPFLGLAGLRRLAPLRPVARAAAAVVAAYYAFLGSATLGGMLLHG